MLTPAEEMGLSGLSLATRVRKAFYQIPEADLLALIDRVRDEAVRRHLIYLRDGQPFPPEAGGPFRLITPGLGDLCANVKNVARIEFTCGPGKDTRPSVPKQH